MKIQKATIQSLAILAVVMTGSWLVPPVIQRIRHLCPVRPNGVSEAEAIPVFARKYKTSCMTCHAPVPIKLNNFGEAFKNNGFRMPSDDEAMTKIEMQELGAEALKEDWVKEGYPGVLPTELPIAWQMYLDGRYDPHKESAGTRNARAIYWDVPHEFEIMTAGTLGKNISFWANMEFKVKTAQTIQNSTTKAITETPVDFVQAYGQFDHLLNTSLINFRMGRFEPRVVPFSRVSRRTIAEDFLTSGHSLSNGFNFKTMQGGVELWGAKSIAQTGGGLTYAVGSLNGSGSTNSDDNRRQDTYGRLSYKFGGMGVAESLGNSDPKSTRNWLDNSIRVGGYTYNGGAGASGLSFGINGVDVDVWYRNLNLYGTAWKGKENLTATTTEKTTAFSVGADYIFLPWITTVLRYEGADMENKAAKHQRRIVPALIVGIRPNVTWTTEAHLYSKLNEITTGLKSGDDLVRSRLRFIF